MQLKKEKEDSRIGYQFIREKTEQDERWSQREIEFLKLETDHKKVSEKDPSSVVLIEDELQDEANNRELKEGPEHSVKHLSLQAQFLQARQNHGQEHHRGRRHRLPHTAQKLYHPSQSSSFFSLVIMNCVVSRYHRPHHRTVTTRFNFPQLFTCEFYKAVLSQKPPSPLSESSRAVSTTCPGNATPKSLFILSGYNNKADKLSFVFNAFLKSV